MRSGLKEVIPYLSARVGGLPADEDHWSQCRMMAYVNQILLAQHSQEKIGLRNFREIQTLARAVDMLLAGNLACLGDLLMQRLKALEISLQDGSWLTARHQELLPAAAASLTSQAGRNRAAKEELREMKLREALEAAKKKSKG